MPLETRLLLSAALGGILYLAVPLGIARIQYVSCRGFSVAARTDPGICRCAIFLGLSLWAFAHEMVLLTKGLDWMSVDFKKLAGADIFEQIKDM